MPYMSSNIYLYIEGRLAMGLLICIAVMIIVYGVFIWDNASEGERNFMRGMCGRKTKNNTNTKKQKGG